MTSIETLFDNFSHALNQHNREEAVKIVTDALENNMIDIQTLYEDLLAPCLNNISSNTIEQESAIWEEHISSNIVRTVLENAFPYVIKERNQKLASASTPLKQQKRALIFCLEEEYHDIGARMTTDFLTILNYETYFIGANTPRREIFKAIEHFSPDLLCISVTNYYHLAKLHSLIEHLNEIKTDKPFQLVLGGYAIHHSSNVKSLVQADYYAHSFEDLKGIKEEIL